MQHLFHILTTMFNMTANDSTGNWWNYWQNLSYLYTEILSFCFVYCCQTKYNSLEFTAR